MICKKSYYIYRETEKNPEKMINFVALKNY